MGKALDERNNIYKIGWLELGKVKHQWGGTPELEGLQGMRREEGRIRSGIQ